MDFNHILVVCAGNICRSPMAQALLQLQYPNAKVDSAGIVAMVNHPADEKAQICMRNLGIDLSLHRGKILNDKLIKENDLILVMSAQQQRYLEQQWPFSKGKVYRIGHWREQDISDPYQKTQQDFDNSCHLIKACIDDWKDYL